MIKHISFTNNTLKTPYCYIFAALFYFLSIHLNTLSRPWAGSFSEILMAISLVFISLSVFIRYSSSLALGALELVLLLFPIYLLSGYILGHIHFLSDAIIYSLYFVLTSLSIITGYKVAAIENHEKCALIVAVIVTLSSFVTVAEALYQWLMLEGMGVWVADTPIGSRPISNFAQPNHMAVYLAIALCGVYHLVMTSSISITTGMFASCFLFLGIGLAQSRSGLLGASIVTIFYGTWCFLRSNTRAASGFSFSLIALWFMFFSTSKLSTWLGLGGLREASSLQNSSGRFDIWSSYLPSIADAPWFGHGAGQIIHLQPHLIMDRDILPLVNWSHNITIDSLIMFGVPLGGLLIFLFVQRIFLVMLAIFKNQVPNEASSLFFSSQLIPFLIAINLEHHHAYLYFLLPAAFNLGVLTKTTNITKYKTNNVITHIPHVIFIISLIIGGKVSLEIFQASNDLRNAQFKADRFISRYADQHYVEHDYLLLDFPRTLIRFLRSDDTKRMPPIDQELFHELYIRKPTPPIMLKYLKKLELNEQSSKICSLIKANRTPHDQITHHIVAQYKKRHCSTKCVNTCN